MLAEYVVLEEEGVVKIPAHLSLEEGATLPCAGVTVWHAMMEHAKLVAGQTVLLQGTGGVSVFGLQLAHALGIQAIITSSSDDKLAQGASTLGAAHTINYKATPDWEKAAMEFTGGRGVDQVVEVGGAGTLARSFGAIRVGGKISMIGGLSGAATELDPRLIMARRANIQGISVGSTQMFEALNRAIAANGIKPVIDKVFGFDEAQGCLPAHGLGRALRQDRDPRGVARGSRSRLSVLDAEQIAGALQHRLRRGENFAPPPSRLRGPRPAGSPD